jgi:hypothetical protein
MSICYQRFLDIYLYSNVFGYAVVFSGSAGAGRRKPLATTGDSSLPIFF